MINLESLTNATITARSLSSLILVRPQKPVGYIPQSSQDLVLNGDNNVSTFDFDFFGQQREVLVKQEAFFFNYEGEQSINLISEITDHYTEDNNAISDQIALRPEEYKTTGFVAELNNIAPEALEPLKLASQKLLLLSAYQPELSVTAINAYNLAKSAFDNARILRANAVQAWTACQERRKQGSK